MQTGDVWRLGHRPELDGLRGVAILLVVLSHGVGRLGLAGSVGVTLFFTLSGFLITSLLLQEHADNGRVNLRKFYMRRARRLAPALLVFLAFMLLFAVVNPYVVTSFGWVLAALFYVFNWGMAALGANAEGISHLWSLSIEEQFYIAFPVVVVLLARRRRVLLTVTLAAAVVSVGLRLALWVTDDNWQRFYFGTDTNAFALLAGAALAMCFVGRDISPTRIRGVGLTAVLGLLFISLAAPTTYLTEARVFLPIATTALAVIAIGWLVRDDHSRLLTHPALRRAGRVSYAWYLWHLPLMHAVWPYVDAPKWLVVLAMAVLSYLIAELSWRLVEQPLLRRKPAERTEPALT